MFLMLSAAFLGMFDKTRDGIVWGVTVILLLIAVSFIFPDSVLAAAMHAILPFVLRS